MLSRAERLASLIRRVAVIQQHGAARPQGAARGQVARAGTFAAVLRPPLHLARATAGTLFAPAHQPRLQQPRHVNSAPHIHLVCMQARRAPALACGRRQAAPRVWSGDLLRPKRRLWHAACRHSPSSGTVTRLKSVRVLQAAPLQWRGSLQGRRAPQCLQIWEQPCEMPGSPLRRCQPCRGSCQRGPACRAIQAAFASA